MKHISKLQLALTFPTVTTRKCSTTLPTCSMIMLIVGLIKIPNAECSAYLTAMSEHFYLTVIVGLDNLELCAAVLTVIQEMKGATIESCEVTPTRMYLKVVNKRMKAEVAVGDVVQAGFVISNSEVGLGSVRVEPLIFRLVCKNGLICKDYSQKKYHVGKPINDSDDSAYELYSNETLAQDDKTFLYEGSRHSALGC